MPNENGNSRSSGEPNDGRDSDLVRREYMRALGSVGLASALGGLGLGAGAAGTAAAETADRSKTVEQRIEEHRTGELEVVVENPDGSTVENATVSVTQQEHDFRWGTAVDAGELNQSSSGDNYQDYIPELFNTAVLENAHKWSFWEDDPQRADQATNWLLDQGLDVRGHVCVWGATQHGAVPSDVESAMDAGDAETVRERSMNHIEEIITHYGDDIHEWEIVNEVQHEPSIIEAVDGEDVDPVEAPIVADWYQHAETVDPTMSIAVNDYNTLEGLYRDEIEAYERHIQYLLDEGVDLDTIGIQGHFNDGEDLSHDEIMDRLDAYGQFGPSIKITEFDMADDSWSDQDKADFFETMLRATFSHPGVEAFIMWGFWDGNHWRDDAPLFYSDWSEKPAYDVWMDLVYGEWWTDESGTTDSSGTYTTTAFLGDHEISVSTDSESTTTTTSVDSSGGTTTISVTVSGQGDGDGDDDDDDDGDGEQQPYDGTPHSVPGRIPAEEFDEGGQDVAYYDESAENEGGDFRTDEYVDVREAPDGTGYCVGYIESGEWLEYTIDVEQSGEYALEALVASDSGGGAFHLEVDGQDVSGAVDVPETGGWDEWETVSTDGVSLSAGRQVIRIAMDESWWDLDYVELSLESSNGDDDGTGDDTGGDDDQDSGGDQDDAPTWDPDEVYTEGDRVSWDGSVWEAQWWTQNQEPGASPWGPWEEV